MMATIRSEWLKLHTVRSHRVLAVVAMVFPLVVTILTAILTRATNLENDSIIRVLVGTSFVSTILYGVLAVISITGDYLHNTIRPTFAATPRRVRVMLAKAVVMSTSATVMHAATLTVGYLVGRAIATSRFDRINFSEFHEGWSMLAGSLVYAPLIALTGLGVGALLRGQGTAIALFMVWPLIGEGLISGLLILSKARSVVKFLPFRAGNAMVLGQVGEESLRRVPAGFVFGLFAVTIFTLGVWVVDRRDA